MALRKPLVLVSGVISELSPDDEIAGSPLGFTTSGNDRVLTNYRENGVTYTVRTAAFTNNTFTLTLAAFTPTLGASVQPSSTLNWDVPCTGFTVQVTNPSDFTAQYISSVASVTQTAGAVSALGLFTAGAKSATPAGGVSWTQAFTTQFSSAVIWSNSTTITGGSAGATVGFNVSSGSGETAYVGSANFNVNWNTPSNSISVANLSGNTFLQSYLSTTYTVGITGMTNAANYSHAVTATGGTISNAAGSGTFTFTSPIHKDNTATTRTVSTNTTFTRPSTVTGTSYSVNLTANSASPTAGFTYPSFWVFTDSVSNVPTRSTIVAGTGYQPSVTLLGDQVKSLAGYITNNSASPRILWFGVRSSASQPTTFQTGASPSLLSTVIPITGNTVTLQPDTPPVGYSGVGFTLYGITLQVGTTYVSIS